MQAAPLIPGPWLVAASLLATLLILLDTRRLITAHRRRHCLAIASLRMLSLGALMAFLARPQTITRTPQLSKLKTAVLIDVSASMDTAYGDATRLRAAERLLNLPEVRTFLRQSPRTEYITFANDLNPLQIPPEGPVRLITQAGNTRLGDALLKLVERTGRETPYTSVILLSDGRNVDGSSPILPAKQLKARKIPVSTVCFPGGAELPDVGVKALNPARKAIRSQSIALSARLHATGQDFPNLTVQLLADGQVLDERTVDVTPRQDETVSFNATLPTAGFHVLTAKVRPSQQDARPDNNADFFSVQVTAPPVFSVLYLDYGMDWEWKFIRLDVSRNPQLKLKAVIQLAEDRFFTQRLQPEWNRKPRFPDQAEHLQDIDVVIVSTHCLRRLSDRQLDTLRTFVEFKGGGLIIRGLATELPETIRPLLPAKRLANVTVGSPRAVHVRHDLIYRHDSAKHLSPQGGAWIQPVTTVATIEQPQYGTRPLATLDSPGGPTFFAVHAFGAGRVAFLGYRSTWQWALASDDLAKMHEALWNQLVVWLAQAAKPMVTIGGHGSRMPAGEPRDIMVDVLGSDFRPAPDAAVSATLVLPDGRQRELAALPHLDEAGRYVLSVLPDQPGEYRLRVRARHRNHTATGTASFLALQDSRETNLVQDDSQLLQDIARITGGKSFTPDQFAEEVANTPISQNVPFDESIRDVVPPWITCSAALIAAMAAWFARRRLGLK